MSKCVDPKLEKMLHHYELGLLSDEDREAFELHLLDCEHCFGRVKKFQATAKLRGRCWH
jgi:anti-sigma factor RsiW